MSNVVAYERLVEKGCLCGTDEIASCPVHIEPSDNRGIAAFFKAGMPFAFPMVTHCAICGAEGLMYPDVELDDPNILDNGPAKHRPTLACPRCSTPGAERALVAEVEVAGLHRLNDRRVFGEEDRKAAA